MSSEHFTRSSYLLFELAKRGIVNPEQIQLLSNRQTEDIATTLATLISVMSQKNRWNPLIQPKPGQRVVFDGEVFVPQESVSQSLDRLGFGVRSTNALKRHGIHTVGQLLALYRGSCAELRQLGVRTSRSIEQRLLECGLCFPDREPEYTVRVRLSRQNVEARAELAGMFFDLDALTIGAAPAFKCKWLQVNTLAEVARIKGDALVEMIASQLQLNYRIPAQDMQLSARRYARLLSEMAEYV